MTKTAKSLICTWLVVLSLAVAGCWGAMKTSPDNPTGAGGLTPNVEDKDAGLVALAPGFDVKSYGLIAVDRFPVTDLAIKDEDDRKLAAEMQSYLQSELVRRLRDTGLFQRVVNLSEAEFKPEADKALRLEGTITRLGGGSQAARAFFGAYGAGRTRAQADMQFVEVPSGRAMMVTADRRIASVGFFGGATRDHFRESFDDMARDLAKFLVRLSKGEAPRKD